MFRQSNSIYILLAFTFFVFANSWEPGVGLDTATYAAIARDILETGNWFRPKMTVGIFDPFIEHPYLGIWLDVLAFKLVGVSAQGIHLVASLFGILSTVALFIAIRRVLDEKTAFFTCLGLLLINVYMNFMSSGWLDMPMVGCFLFAFFFITHSEISSKYRAALAGFFLALSVLIKGVAALGIFPLFFFLWNRENWSLRIITISIAAFLVPISLYTGLHYISQGYIFWIPYLKKQVFVHNDVAQYKANSSGWWWILEQTLQHAHIVAIAGIPGCYYMWKRGHREVALLIIAEFAIHFLAYAFSYRQNRQYLLPIFPWIAVSAAYFISQKVTVSVNKLSQGLMSLAVGYFFLVSFFPVTIHNMGAPAIYAFKDYLEENPRIKHIYFIGTQFDIETGDVASPYIVWYLNRTASIVLEKDVARVLNNLDDSEAFLLPTQSKHRLLINDSQLCRWNETYLLISSSRNCSSKNLRMKIALAKPRRENPWVIQKKKDAPVYQFKDMTINQ